jgi:putative phosphoesterase
MRLGILSDTHNRQGPTQAALDVLRERQISWVLHCGDIEDPEMIALFAGFRAHFVYGNCDSDRQGLRRAIEASGARLHEPFGDLELAGRKLAWMHGDDKRLMRDVEHSGHFDYLFYGHTHVAGHHRTGPTQVINPGALHRAAVKTFVILDLATGQLESIAVD